MCGTWDLGAILKCTSLIMREVNMFHIFGAIRFFFLWTVLTIYLQDCGTFSSQFLVALYISVILTLWNRICYGVIFWYCCFWHTGLFFKAVKCIGFAPDSCWILSHLKTSPSRLTRTDLFFSIFSYILSSEWISIQPTLSNPPFIENKIGFSGLWIPAF